MRLTALRQLTGDYGTVVPGEIFSVPDDVGRQLLSKGVAAFADPPRIVYETKVVTPSAPEVRARDPFQFIPLAPAAPAGDVPVHHDPDPPAMAAVRDSVLAASVVPPDRTAGIKRGRGRPPKHSA